MSLKLSYNIIDDALKSKRTYSIISSDIEFSDDEAAGTSSSTGQGKRRRNDTDLTTINVADMVNIGPLQCSAVNFSFNSNLYTSPTQSH